MRIETSIISSLSELRAIEQQRIADERAAIDRARQAEVDAKRAAEQARRDADDARLRAEREERMRIEIAKAEAEREVRLRVEAAEAAERARHQAILDQQRYADEMELRRAEVAKKRPTWMIVVTAMAAIAAVGLTWFAIDRSNQMAVADHKRDVAVAEAKQAAEDRAEAQRTLEQLTKNLDELDAQVTKAQRALVIAQNDADRKRAAAELSEANQKRALAKQAADDAALKLWKKKRSEKVDVTGCTDTALGCMPH